MNKLKRKNNNIWDKKLKHLNNKTQEIKFKPILTWIFLNNKHHNPKF